MKFRKKPVVVEAIQWDGTEPTGQKLCEWSNCWVWHHGGIMCFVETPEGTREASPGDWIIRGVNGEFCPIKDEIFRQTYEALDDAAPDKRQAAWEACVAALKRLASAPWDINALGGGKEHMEAQADARAALSLAAEAERGSGEFRDG